MSAPHRLDIFKHGHRAVCNGVLIGSFFDVLVCMCVCVGGGGGVGQLGMAHRSDGPASSLRMFGHVHRAMCSGGCQFEVLEEHVRARYVPAYKTRQMRQARKALEPEGVRGAPESVRGRRRALENVDEGRCCWPSDRRRITMAVI